MAIIMGRSYVINSVAETEYFPLACGGRQFSGNNEDYNEITYRVAGTLSYLTFNAYTNTVAATSTGNSRINGADGNLTVSITASTTGEYIDSVNTDAVSATDEVSARQTTTTTGNLYSYTSILFSASSNMTTIFNTSYVYFTNVSADYFHGISGLSTSANGTATEANVRCKINQVGTLANLYGRVNSNSSNNTTTITTRINGASGNLTISVPSTTTGVYEDAVNTDSVSDNDDLNYIVEGDSTGEQFGIPQLSTEFTTTDGKFMMVNCHAVGITVLDNTTRYFHPCGMASSIFTESQCALTTNVAIDTSNLWMLCIANTATENATVTIRKDSADGNQTLSITAETTGEFEDAANTDSFTDSETINYKIAVPLGGTNLKIGAMSILAEPPAATGITSMRQLIGVGQGTRV